MADRWRAEAAAKRQASPQAAASVPRRTEERLARAMCHIRTGMAVLVAVPLLRPRRLQRPAMAWAAAAVAAGQTVWFRRRTRVTGTLRDPALVWGDVACCAAVNLLASRSVARTHRNTGLVQAVSHSLGAAGTAGLGLGFSPSGVGATGALTVDWAASVWPAVTVKLVSDVLGMSIWFVVATLAGREFRDLATLVERAQADSARSQAEAAERLREVELARAREAVHHEIHEHLLPVVDAVADGRISELDLQRLARRAATRARRFILEGRAVTGEGIGGLLTETFDTYREAGLPLVVTMAIEAEPTADLVEALAAAVREALANVLKHVGIADEVTVYVESNASGGEIVVRDRGPGFDAGGVRAGGGLARTFPELDRRGGTVTIDSSPGQGTRVRFSWEHQPGLVRGERRAGPAFDAS